MRAPASGDLADFEPSRPYVAQTTAICQVFAIHPPAFAQPDALSWVERAPTGLTRKADHVRASEPHAADADEPDRCPDWRVTRGDTARDQHIPTLLSGLEANAQDPASERSILEALEQHDPALVEGGVDPNQIDTADGDKIASHVFGPHRDQVIERLSLNGAGSSGISSAAAAKSVERSLELAEAAQLTQGTTRPSTEGGRCCA